MSSLSSEEVPSTNVGSCSDTNRSSKSGSDMFVNTVSLAPMVRAGSLPFRTLCLKYGADLVWGEEIIDKRILKCTRVVNERLSTIDYNVVGERGKGNVDVLIFRTCSAEEGKVIFQLGTSCPDRALAAAQVVESDVAAIDINMGCPKVLTTQSLSQSLFHSLAHSY
jgi:tRNA-dihydrouridine synthase 2